MLIFTIVDLVQKVFELFGVPLIVFFCRNLIFGDVCKESLELSYARIFLLDALEELPNVLLEARIVLLELLRGLLFNQPLLIQLIKQVLDVVLVGTCLFI